MELSMIQVQRMQMQDGVVDGAGEATQCKARRGGRAAWGQTRAEGSSAARDDGE